MKTKLKKSYFKRVNLIIIVVLLLIIFWFVASLVNINRVSFSVVTYQTRNNIRTQNGSTEFHINKTFRGEFKSLDNNLGIIILPLSPYKKPRLGREDIVVFRFREKGKSGWDFKREYKSGLFDSQSYFSFGFPVITDSKDKNYQLELTSSAEDGKNNISVKSNNFITGYQYPKSAITSGNIDMLRFMLNKTLGSFSDLDFVIKSLTYLIPLVLFLVVILILKHGPLKMKYLKIFVPQLKHGPLKMKYLKIFVPLLIVPVILLPQYIHIDSLIILVFLWTVTVVIYKFKSKVSFILSFLLILTWVLIIPLGLESLQNMLNEWGYAFLFFGCMQLLFEERNNIEK